MALFRRRLGREGRDLMVAGVVVTMLMSTILGLRMLVRRRSGGRSQRHAFPVSLEKLAR